MFAVLCFFTPTAPMSVGAGGPPGDWQKTATPTPLATSTWSSPNGVPYGGAAAQEGGWRGEGGFRV